MSDNITPFPPREDHTASLFGPEECGHALIVDGRHIPKIVIFDHGEVISFCLDGRMSFEFPREHAYMAAAFAANAMAIGAGYAFLGSETKERPFAPQVFEVKL